MCSVRTCPAATLSVPLPLAPNSQRYRLCMRAMPTVINATALSSVFQQQVEVERLVQWCFFAHSQTAHLAAAVAEAAAQYHQASPESAHPLHLKL